MAESCDATSFGHNVTINGETNSMINADENLHASISKHHSKSSLWLALLAPIVGVIYFLQLHGAFLFSINEVVASAKLERDLYLTPRLSMPDWDDHYFYRIIASGISVAIATFICGGLTRTRGKLGGVLGGLGISAVMGFLLFIGFKSDRIEFDTVHAVITALILVAAPVLGGFLGVVGEEVSNSKESGFAGIPRLHFLWLWLPTYWYGLALIAPLASLFGGSPYSVFTHVMRLIPVLLYGAPLLFGLAIMSGEFLQRVPGFFRQIIGSVVLAGGLVVIGTVQYFLISIFSR